MNHEIITSCIQLMSSCLHEYVVAYLSQAQLRNGDSLYLD